jgi:hypothetical protein
MKCKLQANNAAVIKSIASTTVYGDWAVSHGNAPSTAKQPIQTS